MYFPSHEDWRDRCFCHDDMRDGLPVWRMGKPFYINTRRREVLVALREQGSWYRRHRGQVKGGGRARWSGRHGWWMASQIVSGLGDMAVANPLRQRGDISLVYLWSSLNTLDQHYFHASAWILIKRQLVSAGNGFLTEGNRSPSQEGIKQVAVSVTAGVVCVVSEKLG